jgi:hypothetical protein
MQDHMPQICEQVFGAINQEQVSINLLIALTLTPLVARVLTLVSIVMKGGK